MDSASYSTRHRQRSAADLADSGLHGSMVKGVMWAELRAASGETSSSSAQVPACCSTAETLTPSAAVVMTSQAFGVSRDAEKLKQDDGFRQGTLRAVTAEAAAQLQQLFQARQKPRSC